MGVYVKNGTPLNGPSLCESCTYAHILRGYGESEAVIVCMRTTPEIRVEFRVRECTGFADKTRESLYEMRRIAWSISPDRHKETVGFASPSAETEITEDLEIVLRDKQAN